MRWRNWSVNKDECCRSGRWFTWLNVPPTESSIMVRKLSFGFMTMDVPRWCGHDVQSFTCATERLSHSCCPPRVNTVSFPKFRLPFRMLPESFRNCVCHRPLLVHPGITPAFPGASYFFLLPSGEMPATTRFSPPSECKIWIFNFFLSIFLNVQTFKSLSHSWYL